VCFSKSVTVNQECPIYAFMPQDNYGHAMCCWENWRSTKDVGQEQAK